jgi:5-methylcytosine-specific restriction endonuclease McrA
MSKEPLPLPGSPELKKLLKSETHRSLYAFLYKRRDDPPIMIEIRAYMAEEFGEAPSQTDRRVRDLRRHFYLPAVQIGKSYYYKLTGRTDSEKGGVRKSISSRLRAEGLRSQRCAQCGKTPLGHHVVLVVDHKIPWSWGGTDDIDNLQPLCEECNSGKKDFYATYDRYADQIRKASGHPEPHGRTGELLKAFDGEWVPSSLIEVVASLGQYQDDWQRRLRDLRFLDWKIVPKRKKDPATGRVNVWYRVDVWKPWPEGSIRAEVARRDPSNKSSQRREDEPADTLLLTLPAEHPLTPGGGRKGAPIERPPTPADGQDGTLF